MAQTPTTRDSSALVLRAARRHQRLTKRTGHDGCIALAQRLDEPIAVLAARVEARDRASAVAGDAFDDWVQDDRRLDRFVDSVARKADDYDADHAANTYALLFAGRSAAEVRAISRADEPAEVEKIVARGAALPDGHPARPLLTELASLADHSRRSHRAYLDALAAVGPLDALAEQSKLALLAVFRDNVHDIVRLAGPDLAEDCFPELRRRVSSEGPPDEPAAG